MATSTNKLDPDRLMQAADASLKAAVEIAGYACGASTCPADLMGTPLQPECLDPFTKLEIQEACAFLVRLGILERPRAKRNE